MREVHSLKNSFKGYLRKKKKDDHKSRGSMIILTCSSQGNLISRDWLGWICWGPFCESAFLLRRVRLKMIEPLASPSSPTQREAIGLLVNHCVYQVI